MTTEKNTLIMMEVVSDQDRRIYFFPCYPESHGNKSYYITKDHLKDMGKHWKYSGRKRKATGFAYLEGSPYCDAEGSSNLRPFNHDSVINDDSIIGENRQTLIVQIVPP